jgi:hypothetical protein
MVLAVAVSAVCSAATLGAQTITGSVQNQSRNKPAAGDEVILLRLDQGIEEEGRARTNDLGSFTIKVQFPDKPHLLRIMHQGVNYDQRARVGDALTIDVFDGVSKVQGVSGSIEIIRTGSNGNLLHVSDMIEITNESRPPLTQAGERTFDVYLPAKARLDSVFAAGSGKIGVLIAASPVSGEPGHFTVNFPLRPGSTRFAFNYDVPYDGHAAFRTRLAYPLRQLDVMIPPTMKFSSRSSAFQVLVTGNSDYQVQSANHLNAGEGPSFEISGTGQIPPLENRAQPQAGSTAGAAGAPAAPTVTNREPQAPPGAAPATATPTSPLESWVVGTAAVLVLGACLFVIWLTRRGVAARAETKPRASVAKGRRAGPSATPLLEALKQELLELETGRIEGSISRDEYDAAKRALEGTVKRALAQAPGNK